LGLNCSVIHKFLAFKQVDLVVFCFVYLDSESWEGTTRRSAKPGTETNPILATFKAFIAAFIKFWSE
jgi:hypothetical protein